MRSEFLLAARTVVCLALGVISLDAAPIYHRVYEGQARLIPQTATCFQSITVGEWGQISYSEIRECGSLGSVIYDRPILDLPPGSVVLSAELRQWGSLDIELFDHVDSVEPVDPAQPFSATAWGNNNSFIRLEGEYVYIVAQNDFHPAFDVVDTDYLAYYLGDSGCIVAVTYEGPPDCAMEIGMP